MRCANCEHDNPAGSVFCNACGSRLGASAPQTAAPRTSAELSEPSSRISAAAGERKQITVLFADIEASMELLRDRDPEEARALMDGVVERMMEAVHRYEGTVNQVLGDGIMALFGAPVAHEDHAVRACYTALRMQEAVARYADEVHRAAGRAIRIRVGLNSGEVVVRSIGNDLHMDYTAVGESTHLAARMQQIASPGSTLITASTRRLAEGAIEVRELGERAVKGLDHPVVVYELVGAVPARSIFRTTVAQPKSRFVGREVELGRLASIAAEAAEGRGQTVGVCGEPGVGKTRLLYEFVRSPGMRPFEVLECRSLSYESAAAWAPVVRLLRRYFELDGRQSSDDVIAKISARLLALDGTFGDLVSPVASLLGVLPDSDPWHRIEAAERRRLVLDALTRILLTEAKRRPLLLIFEDLQWADSATRSVAERLMEHVGSGRLMLTVDYRPDFHHDWAGRPSFTELTLGPLSPELSHDLLDTMLVGDQDMDDLKGLLVDRSRGNPFFIEEMVHSLFDTKRLVEENGRHRLTGDLASVDIPANVQSVLAARIDRLAANEKLLLQTAAVIGMEVPAALLQRLTDLATAEFDSTLAGLVSARFIEPTALYPDVEYRFRHPLTRDVASASLLREQRRMLHARIVAAIEDVYEERLSNWIDHLARHASRGELWLKAALYNRQAGTRAAAHATNADAVKAYEAALHALAQLPPTRETAEESIDIRLELIPALLQLGRLDELLSMAREAETRARDIGDDRRLGRVYAHLVNYYYLRGQPAAAIAYGHRYVDVVRPTGDLALQGLGRQYIGQSHHLRGEYAAAEEALRTNLALDPDQHATCYIASCSWLAWTLAERGDFEAAYAALDRASRAAEKTEHPYGRAIAWTVAGLIALRRGHVTHAVLPLGRSLELTQRKHLTVWEPVPSSLLGLAFVRLGHVAAGLRLLEQSITRSQRLGVRAYLATWMLNLAEGYLASGDETRATTTAEEALSIAEQGGERGHEAYIHQLLGDIAFRTESRRAEARKHYDKALRVANSLGLRPLAASVHWRLSRLYGGQRAAAAAQRHLGTAEKIASQLGLQPWQAAGDTVESAGRLLIVARSNPDLYDFLAKKLTGAHGLEVVVDRRRRREDIGAERRRHPAVEEDLQDWQFAIAARQT